MQLDHASTSGGKRLLTPTNPACPLFTVVTVVFNGGKELESSILSVLNQSYKSVEYVIIDGGSTDGTLDILRRYDDAIDYWISEPDNGIYDAMNKAIRLARGKWVYFLGSDDTLCNCLERVAEYLKDERTIYFGTVNTTGIKPITRTPLRPWQLLRRNICQQAIFYPRAVFEWRTFDRKYRILADWEFNMRCYSNPLFDFQYIPIVVANYNNVTGISSVSIDEQFMQDQAVIIRECLPAACYVWHRMKGVAHLAIDGVRGEAMTYLEYFASVGEAPGTYFLITIITLACYLFILRKQFYSIFDPLFYATVFGAFASTCASFLWWRDLMDTRYFIQFTCTECAFFIGLLLFKPINFTKLNIRADKEGGGQRRFLNALYMVSATTFILTQTISYATLGIPILSDSRLSYYAAGGGIGALGHIIGVTWSFSCYLLIYRLAHNSETGRRIYLSDIFVGFALLTSVALSGSRSGLMQVIFLIFYSRFMLKGKHSGLRADKFLGRLQKAIMITAAVGAILIVSVKAGGGAIDGSIFVLLQRLAANGDVFFMAYPTHIIDTLSPKGAFFALFGSLLAMFRFVPPTSLPEPLGFQIFRAVYGSFDFVGPNPRHNVFGVVYLGIFGAMIYSLVLGVMVSFVRNRISRFVHRGSAIEPLYVFLAISCVTAPTDIGMLMMDIGSALLVAPFLYATAAILYFAVPRGTFGSRQLSLQSAVSKNP